MPRYTIHETKIVTTYRDYELETDDSPEEVASKLYHREEDNKGSVEITATVEEYQ